MNMRFGKLELDVWIPNGWVEVGPARFSGETGFLQVRESPDADLVDFGISSQGDAELWHVDEHVVAVVPDGPASSARAVSYVVGDEVWLREPEFGISQVRCTYVFSEGGDEQSAVRDAWLRGGHRLHPGAFALDAYGHQLFGPLPIPGEWLPQGLPNALEALSFGGGFLSFGEAAPGAGFELCLLPGPTRTTPISREAAARSLGRSAEPFRRWKTAGWVCLESERALAVFRDAFGYAWLVEYRRGGLSSGVWDTVLAGFSGYA